MQRVLTIGENPRCITRTELAYMTSILSCGVCARMSLVMTRCVACAGPICWAKILAPIRTFHHITSSEVSMCCPPSSVLPPILARDNSSHSMVYIGTGWKGPGSPRSCPCGHRTDSAMVGFALSALPALVLSLSAAASPVHLAKRNPVPSFVLANAPVSHLYSKEQWWPSDVAVHLTHVMPEVNFSVIAPSVTFQNISSLSSDVCLTSKDDVSKSPAWLNSVVGMPDANGVSSAPTTIVLVNKPGGILDAFFFYFYSYDHGGKVSLTEIILSIDRHLPWLSRFWT